jgi:peptide/nickel transport system ATP-binding protein
MSQTGQRQLTQNNSRKQLYQIREVGVIFRRSRGVIRRHETIVRAIRNVSFDVYESELLSIVGESGSGKTTIARCMMGLATPSEGSIRFRDSKVSKFSNRGLLEYWRQVQMVFQDPFESLNPRLDVLDTLSVPLRQLARIKNNKEIELEVLRLLSEVGLDPKDVMYKFPHQLSGGERQRVNIAKALAPNPKVLIADEPITMLDASQRLNILSLLIKLKESRDLTIILITHDLASAKIMSDRTIVMYSGRIVEIGPTEKLLTKPHHPYSELILSATPRLLRREERSDEANVSYGSLGIEESMMIEKGCVFAPRCKYRTSTCLEVDPPLLERSKAHLVACHNPLNKAD